MTWPECSSSIRIRRPSDRVEWMSAWPMSRIWASYFARMPVKAAVSPIRSLPVMRTRICS